MALRRPLAQAGRRCSGTGGVQRMASTGPTRETSRTSRRIPGELSATRFGLRVYAGHRPATQSSEDRQNGAASIPHRVYEEGLRIAFPQVIPEGVGPCQGLGDLRFGLSSIAAHTSS